jgi:hypothetical protein
MRSGVPAAPVLDRGGARVRYSRGRAAPRKDAAPLAPLMKLDPVYLVAPEPQRDAKRFSRRACLGLAALGFGFGALLGSGLRRALATGGTATTIDAELQWALALQRGPLERLVRDRVTFLAIVDEHAAELDRFEAGLSRLVEAVLRGEVDATSRRLAAEELSSWLEGRQALLPAELVTHVAELRRLGR